MPRCLRRWLNAGQFVGGTDKQHLYHNSTLALHGDTGEIVS